MVSCFLNFSPFAYNADPRDFIRVCLFCFRMNKGDFVSLNSNVLSQRPINVYRG